MVNEDIVTSLKNAVAKGESLENAKQVMINSGYNSQEIEEASNFIGGVASKLETKPDEHLTMPSQKFPKTITPKVPEIKPPPIKPPQIKPVGTIEIPKIKQQPSPSTTEEIKKPIKKKYTKEIILLVILLLLVGIFIITVIFRENIINFFSG